MSSIYKLIKDIEARPRLFLGDNINNNFTLIVLRAFLAGYYMREGELSGSPSASWQFISGFQDYVAEYYNEKRAYGWDQIISDNCLPSEEPLQVFFILVDKYVSENPDMGK